MTQDLRFNVPPGWPAQPEGWRPEPGWQPDPSWPAAPPDWEFWVPASTSSPELAFALPSSPRPDTQPPGMIQVPGAVPPAYPSYQAPPPPGGSYQAVAGPPTPSNPQATASLVLGIVSMFASALFVTAIVGVVLGIVGLARSGRTDPPIGRGKAITGIVLSVLSAVLGVFVLSFVMNAMSDFAEGIEEAGAPTVFEDGDSSGRSEDGAPTPDLADFIKVDAAEWEAIAKDPDKAKDRAVIVFAEVVQFDSSTGPDRFRASAGVDRPGAELELETNALFVGDEARLDGVVTGDVLQVHAVVTGSLEYETQLGGVATVPVLEIAQLKDVGFADLSKDVKLGSAERIQADWVSLPATVTNSTSQRFTYLVDVVAESKDGSTSYGTGTGLAEKLKPGQKMEVVVDFFDEVPADAVFRVESVERFQE